MLYTDYPMHSNGSRQGYFARDLVKIEFYRAENLISNDIEYVMIGSILTHPRTVQFGSIEIENYEMYLSFIDTLGENP